METDSFPNRDPKKPVLARSIRRFLRRAVGRLVERLVGQLASDYFLERNIGKRHPRRRLHHRPMS